MYTLFFEGDVVQPEAAGMNPYELKRKWGDKISFWGGLGSQSAIPFGAPAAIKAEVRRLKAEMGAGGGYIRLRTAQDAVLRSGCFAMAE